MEKSDALDELMAFLIAETHDAVLGSMERYAEGAKYLKDSKALEDALDDPKDKTVFIAQLACQQLMANMFDILGSEFNVKILVRNEDAGVDWFELRDEYFGEEFVAALTCEDGWLDRYSKYPNIVTHLDAPEDYAAKMKAALQKLRDSRKPA